MDPVYKTETVIIVALIIFAVYIMFSLNLFRKD